MDNLNHIFDVDWNNIIKIDKKMKLKYRIKKLDATKIFFAKINFFY